VIGSRASRYSRLVLKRAGLLSATCLLLLLPACGGSGGLASGPAEPTECAAADRAEVTVEASRLGRLMGQPDLEGTVTVRVLGRADPPSTFEDPFIQQPTVAQGKFVGVRYSLANDTNAEVQPSTQVSDSLRLTDGERSWAVADYSGAHQTGVSGAWAETQGDEQPETMVGAGFEQTTWAVFDVPADARPTGLALSFESGGQECLALP